MCKEKKEKDSKYEIPDEGGLLTVCINDQKTRGKFYQLVGLQVLDDRLRKIKKHRSICDEVMIECKIGAMKKRVFLKGLFQEIEEYEWE